MVKKVLVKKSDELDSLNKELEIRIEERSKQLDKTIEIEKLRTAFFTNISHELKTPLSVILSAQQLLSLKLGKLLEGDDFMSINKQMTSIKQNSYRLIRLINNLIDITRIDTDNYGFVFKKYNIVKLIRDIVESVSGFIESHKLNFIFNVCTEEKMISCDADMVERVILNLLANAVKFTPQNGMIQVSVSSIDNFVVISVKDTGIGIPPEMRPLIFDRFVQVDNSLTRSCEGSGIGLSLVKSIIDMHEGTIEVISELGVGSEFIIKLPLTKLDGKGDEEGSRLIESNKKVERLQIEFADIYDNN